MEWNKGQVFTFFLISIFKLKCSTVRVKQFELGIYVNIFSDLNANVFNERQLFHVFLYAVNQSDMSMSN